MAFEDYNVSDGLGGFEDYNVSDGLGGFEQYNVVETAPPPEGYLSVFKHLLPRGVAWSITATKQLRSWFAGLVPSLIDDTKLFVDNAYNDLFPQSTRGLEQWEQQFGLDAGALTEQARRDRIDAAWKAVGGQSPRYIQDTLQAAGFDVYVHEWWDPGSNPPITRNPNDAIGNLNAGVTCGNTAATCGNTAATCGGTFKGQPQGKLLVNIITELVKDTPGTCGGPAMTCGNTAVNTAGYIRSQAFRRREYAVPPDPNKWPYILYIGAPVWPEMASMPGDRREEFERLCLRICPAQQWLGILVSFQNEYRVSDGLGGFEDYNVSDGLGGFEQYNVG